jgi:hypothetical protein
VKSMDGTTTKIPIPHVSTLTFDNMCNKAMSLALHSKSTEGFYLYHVLHILYFLSTEKSVPTKRGFKIHRSLRFLVQNPVTCFYIYVEQHASFFAGKKERAEGYHD